MLSASPQLNLSGGGLIEDEKFDFDFPLSPPDVGATPGHTTSHNRTFTCEEDENATPEDEEEVFFGPMGYAEKCIAVAVHEESKAAAPWSPVSNEQYVELFKESQRLLYHLTRNSSSESSTGNESTAEKQSDTSNLPEPIDETKPSLLNIPTTKMAGLKPPNTNNMISAPKTAVNSTIIAPKSSQNNTLSGRKSLIHKTISAPKTIVKNTISMPKSSQNNAIATPKMSLNNTICALPKSSLPSVAVRGSGLKPPSIKQALAVPSNPARSKSPGLNRTYDSSTKSALRAPSSGLKAPSVVAVKSKIKAPQAKPQLMKPNPVILQRKTLAANRNKFTKPLESSGLKGPGPFKAVAPLKAVNGPAKSATASSSGGKLSSTASVKRDSTGAAKEIKPNLHESTPVKKLKKVQPKKIFSGPAPKQDPQTEKLVSTPGKVITSSPCHSEKRRSFLPTPKRAGSSGFRSSGSSVSSIDSIYGNSPAFPVKPGRPKVQHTPVGGNKENEPKRSIWSPVPKHRFISKEEELTKCTKHTGLKLKN